MWAQDLREVAQNELKQVEADLDRESREDGELRDRFQQRWARPASAALNSTLREKIAGAQAVCVGGGFVCRLVRIRMANLMWLYPG